MGYESINNEMESAVRKYIFFLSIRLTFVFMIQILNSSVASDIFIFVIKKKSKFLANGKAFVEINKGLF